MYHHLRTMVHLTSAGHKKKARKSSSTKTKRRPSSTKTKRKMPCYGSSGIIASNKRIVGAPSSVKSLRNTSWNMAVSRVLKKLARENPSISAKQRLACASKIAKKIRDSKKAKPPVIKARKRSAATKPTHKKTTTKKSSSSSAATKPTHKKTTTKKSSSSSKSPTKRKRLLSAKQRAALAKGRRIRAANLKKKRS